MNTPTPAEIVAALSPSQRDDRVHALIEQAFEIRDEALATHLEGKHCIGTAILFSGGNDSTVLAHLFRRQAQWAIHANTTIGIEATRQFVRDTCTAWRLPLIEKVAPISYRDIVLDRGFPGPAMHYKMYQRLKERCLDAAKRDLLTNPRAERILFLGGIRRAESQRRSERPAFERDGSTIWASPLIMWTKLDLNTYRTMHPDVPQNPVSAALHMSGECLCGAFAHPGELDEIAEWFPGMADEIRALEAEVRAAGVPEPFCRWGHGEGKPSDTGRACGSCLVRGQMTLGEAS